MGDFIFQVTFFLIGFYIGILIFRLILMVTKHSETPKKECSYHSWEFKSNPAGLECSICHYRVKYDK